MIPYPKNIDKNLYVVGWPMEYLKNSLDQYKGMEKRDLILFPHRLAPEKQPEIFRDLKDSLPQYEFILCQEQNLTKNDYHNLLGEAKIIFSANLQETLGISWYEGALVDTIPMVPDRLSYSEMALDEFKYPSDWTHDFNKYFQHKEQVIQSIKNYIENYETFKPTLLKQVTKLQNKFFSGNNLYKTIQESL